MLPCFVFSTREHPSSTDWRRVYLRAINPVLVTVYLFALLLLGLWKLYPVLSPLGRLVCFPFIILIGNCLWFWLLDNCTVPVAIASIYGFFSIAGVVKLFPNIPHTVGSTLITSGIVWPSVVVAFFILCKFGDPLFNRVLALNFGRGFFYRRGQDDFRDEQHDRWEENEFATEYGEEWEENEFATEYGEEWEEDYVAEEPVLNEEHRKRLKQLFRRAAQSCHPDKAPEHLKDTAHELFAQLNAAFQANDIEAVQNISDIVRSGVFRVDRFNSQSLASSR